MRLMCLCFRHGRCRALLFLLLFAKVAGQSNNDANIGGYEELKVLLTPDRCTASPATPGFVRHLAYIGIARQADNDYGALVVSTCAPSCLIPAVRAAVTQLFSIGPIPVPGGAQGLVEAQVTNCSLAISTLGAPAGSNSPSDQPAGNRTQFVYSQGTANASNIIVTNAAEAFGALVPGNALLALRDLAVVDGSFSYADILLPLRGKLFLGEMGGASVLPMDAPVLLMVYRKDVLAVMGWQVPRTWDELAELVESYNKSRPDWGPNVALCATNGETSDGLSLFSAVWHSLAQSRGLGQGVFFDLSTMQPLVQTPAFKAAVQLFARIWPLALMQPAGVSGFSHPGLRLGTCAISIGTFEQDVARLVAQRQWSDADDGATGAPDISASAFGVAQLPGSKCVLSQERPYSLVTCSAQNCPYGDSTAESVNRAPYIPSNLLVGGITNGSTTAQRLLAWHTLSYLAGPEESLRLLMQSGTKMSPFRASHFTASARSAWAAAGYDAALISEGLDEQQAALMHPNLAWDLHMAGGAYYRSALSDFLASLLNGSSSCSSFCSTTAPFPLDADQLSLLMDQLYATLSSHYSLSSSTAAQYTAFLNIGYAPSQQQQEQAGEIDNGATNGIGQAVGRGVAITVAGLAVLVAGLYVVHRRACGLRSRSMRGSWCPDAPTVSPNTTLAITDIEGSTRLWEELPEVVMDCALRLHHACLRRVLVRHQGYESATEGDSFILAFHRPDAALSFAVEAQQELLEQDWPAELLANEMCTPVYTCAPAGFPFRRPATLETVLSRISIRPHSHTSGGGGAGWGGGVGGGNASPHTQQLLGQALPVSLARSARSRGSPAPSSTLSQVRLGSSMGPWHRRSIDLSMLNNHGCEGTRTMIGRTDVRCRGGAVSELGMKTQTAPMAVPLAAPSKAEMGLSGFCAATLLPVDAATASVTAIAPEVAAAVLSEPVPMSSGSASSCSLAARLGCGDGGEPALARLQHLQPGTDVAQAPCCRGDQEAQLVLHAGRGSTPAQNSEPYLQQHQGVPPRKQGELSRKLQQLHDQQRPHQVPQQQDAGLHSDLQHVIQQTHQQQLTQKFSQQHSYRHQRHQQHPQHVRYEQQLIEVPPISASPLTSSGGWAIIHGGETVAVLEEHISGSATGGGTDGGDTPRTACDKVNELPPEYGSGPSTVLPPTASTSRTPTGSGIVPARGCGNVASTAGVRTAGEQGVEGTDGSEALFTISQNGHVSRGVPGIRAQRISPSPSPSPSAGIIPRSQTPPQTASRSPLPQGAITEAVYATGGMGTWDVCTLEESVKAAVRGVDEGGGPTDRKLRLLWRGLRIRMGLHSGITNESEMTYNRASARTVYSGDCAGIVRVVADSAQGGLVLLSEACMEALVTSAAAGGLHGAASEAVLINVGRYRVAQSSAAASAATESMDYDPASAMSLFMAIGPDLAVRAAVLPPPRKIAPVGLSLYAAPVGRAAMACLNVPDVGALRDWDEGAIGQALALIRRTVLEQLACHRGYLISEDLEQGSLNAAFAFPLDAARWALRCREVLSSPATNWPASLLAHALCQEEELPRVHLAVAATAAAAAVATGTSYGSVVPSCSSRAGGGGGGGGGGGTGSGALPSPVSGRGRNRNSQELSHALTTTCDNTPLWLAHLGTATATQPPVVPASTVAGGPRATRRTGECGAATEDGVILVSEEAFAGIMDRGLQPSYTSLGPRAVSTPADLDSAKAAPPSPPVMRHTFRGLASGAGVRDGSPSVCVIPSSISSRIGNYSRISARQLEGVGMHDRQETAAAVTAAPPPPAVLTGSIPIVDRSSVTGTTTGATPRETGYFNTKFAAQSLRLQMPTGVAHPVANTRDANGGGVGAAALALTSLAAAVSSGAGGGSGAAATAENGMLNVREGVVTADVVGHSSGGGGVLPGVTTKPLTLKTPLTWAQSDDMEDTVDGGDIFSLHLGGMDGCAPFGRAPGVSLSAGFATATSWNGPAAALAAGGASGSEPAVADKQDTVILRGPRIRVGIDCGLVEWAISSSNHGLTYSGASRATAEKLASLASPGQVLSTYSVMLELHRMQASLRMPSEAEEVAAAERGNMGGFNSETRPPAVVGVAVPPPLGRTGLTSARYRRQQIFACRFTHDWEEALREYDQLMAQMASAHHSNVSGWSSPRSGRLSPFSSPWNWSAAGRPSKRPSSIALAPPLKTGEGRRSNSSRRSLDLFLRGSASFLLRGVPQPQQNEAWNGIYGGSGATGGGAAGSLAFSQSHPLPSVHPTPALTPSRTRMDVSRSRIIASAGPTCCPVGHAASHSSDGRGSVGSGRGAGKPNVQPVFVSASSNVMPAQLLPPPPQSRQLVAGSGGAPIAVASPPAVTYTSLPCSLAVDLNRPGLISTFSWRSRADANGDGGAGGVSRISPSDASASSQQVCGGIFAAGVMEDSFSLSLRHQLQADVKRTNSHLKIGAFATGVGPSILSSTPEHDLSCCDERESDTEFNLTPHTQPRPPPPPPPPLHQSNDTDPPASAFGSGVIGAVTPAVRTSAVTAANSSSASVGSILPLSSRTGQGQQHGSTGTRSSSTAAGLNGGSGGGGSACSSSASGMLQQALRQHQSYARRQLRQQQQQQQQAAMRREQQHPWQQMAVAEPAVCNPLHRESIGPALLYHPESRQPAPSAAAIGNRQLSPSPDMRTLKGAGAGAGVGGQGRELGCNTIVPHAGAPSATADVSKLRQQRHPPHPSPPVPAHQVGPTVDWAPVGPTDEIQADITNTISRWPSEVRTAAQKGYGAAGALKNARPYAAHGTAETLPILATALTTAVAKAESASSECTVKAAYDVVRDLAHGSQACPDDGRPRHPNGRVELACRRSPTLDVKGLSAGNSHHRTPELHAGASEDGEELTGVGGGGTVTNAAADTDGTEGDAAAAFRDGRSILDAGRAVTKLDPVATTAVATSSGTWHGVAPPAAGRVPQSPRVSSAFPGHVRTWNGAQQRAQAQGSTCATANAIPILLQHRRGQSTCGCAQACNAIPTLGSDSLGGSHWPNDADGYVARAAGVLRAQSMQGHYGSPAAAAMERGVWAASSNGGSRGEAQFDPGLRNPPTWRASTADRTACCQLYTQPLQPLQPHWFFVPTGLGSGVTGDLGIGPFLASAGGEVYESYEHSAVSEDCDDSRTSARPPAGWRPGVHPPPPPGGGSAAPSPGARTFCRLGSLATRSDSTSTHGLTQNAVSGLAEGSTGTGGRKGYVTLARGGGFGGAAVTVTVPSGSACTLSLAPVHSACHNLDEPELWRDETYTEPLGLEA
ncbi:hypothetical protein VaNZ11_003629 [Volvox africanus]|uniref:Guanylate cyclase domain-containing protein n=1 Tax=Volvox africanus TaxID=51714 RepID=A0ABQ5RUR8_9CHLO|nr:hypothetical protein VaNZ11_003629 [Volvox africanus]